MFNTRGHLEAWKRTFRGPSNSPAHHTRVLVIRCPEAITAADGAEGGWIPTFSSLERLVVEESPASNHLNPAAFRKFALTLNSLSVTSPSLPLLQVFDLIRSLPLLEDLTLAGEADMSYDDPDSPHTVVPSSLEPSLTGALFLYVIGGIACTANRLLNLPNGLRFRKLVLQWGEREDTRYIAELVTACSGTLRFLDLSYTSKGTASFCWANRLS